MGDKERASEALRKLAEYKLKQRKIGRKIASKGKTKLNQLGIDPESDAKSAALMKIMHDASQGKMNYDLGDFNIEGSLSPKEKKIKFGWKKRF